ncbi:hypothetical protein DACRYDRAFT_23977 [Dacryopinax primogenitus]|uniref:Uncharacterized protein n=1 Tax=Dacryopinax primogenitus (strain DJM 731) TaxID=1858805 RepID=M5FTM6_DACPD|nr:uncharacterized protein DACRYDRAFT_23977 [Dacryopinax primogenitus]EJT99453.1 hypothetical protein DACRYDRAFT_23977 [Dacryopinax primogenitus]
MATTQQPGSLNTSSAVYICAGAIVEGLPHRGFLKSEGRYSLKLLIGGSELWRSRQITTKGSRAVWDGEQDMGIC